ncbi:MAG: right-handed parallel beta-helix repeat-containing protein [Saprospiraceae bacterium]|nr:right-handed parallel beta-helix repeat-containing protein [Saprospiraceae bacterium]
MKVFIRQIAFLIFLILVGIQCSSEPEAKADAQAYQKLQAMLLDAQPGEVLSIPAGVYELDRPLSLDAIPGVTIRGAGMDKTVFSFITQEAGAEGLRITSDSITLMDFTVQDALGDAIKFQGCQGVTIRRVKTTWTQGAKATNGGYGLYPVQCKNVLIDSCEASFASDAGIYVGQSQDVIVRNCYAHENVAGIEIENCINSQVYDNLAENNSGGILVFDLPDLQVVNGHHCEVFRNQILDNNHKNFAAEGNMVAIVPPGTGIILLAAKKVNVHDNRIAGHKTIGTVIASYHVTELPWKDERYDPFTYDINIHHNRYDRKSALPDLSKDFGKMVNMLFPGKPQDILYDGILREGATGANPMNVCVHDNQAEDLRFSNVDAAHDFDQVSKDPSPYSCL